MKKEQKEEGRLWRLLWRGFAPVYVAPPRVFFPPMPCFLDLPVSSVHTVCGHPDNRRSVFRKNNAPKKRNNFFDVLGPLPPDAKRPRAKKKTPSRKRRHFCSPLPLCTLVSLRHLSSATPTNFSSLDLPRFDKGSGCRKKGRYRAGKHQA